MSEVTYAANITSEIMSKAIHLAAAESLKVFFIVSIIWASSPGEVISLPLFVSF